MELEDLIDSVRNNWLKTKEENNPITNEENIRMAEEDIRIFEKHSAFPEHIKLKLIKLKKDQITYWKSKMT